MSGNIPGADKGRPPAAIRTGHGESLKKMNRKLAHTLMTFTVVSWGLEYSLAKNAMEIMDSMTLIFFKYAIALVIIAGVKFRMEGAGFMRKQDVLLFIFCAAMGEILYFYMEYEAMNYMPVSLITIMLSFVPVVSILIEWAAYHRTPSVMLLLGVAVTMGGLAFIIGVDLETILQGRWPGYLLCVGAVLSWNVYNYITAHLGKRYRPLTLTVNQLTCTVLLSAPYAIGHLPEAGDLTLPILVQVLYLGIFSGGVGFIIYVAALYSLGPTTVSIYANFMPISATFFGWLMLGELISGMQIAGGVVVIAAGYYVIREKGRLEGIQHV